MLNIDFAAKHGFVLFILFAGNGLYHRHTVLINRSSTGMSKIKVYLLISILHLYRTAELKQGHLHDSKFKHYLYIKLV